MNSLKVIAVASLKGGVGKTTSALNIAGVLRSKGLNVVVADEDRIKSASNMASLGNLPFPVTTLTGAARMAREMELDYIVIDSRGGMDDEKLYELAETSDLLILPSNPEVMSLDGMQQTVEMLDTKGLKQKAVALLTMTRQGKRLDASRLMLEALDIPVMASTVRFSDAFKDASLTGSLVRDVKTNTLAKTCWLDYGRVVDEIFIRLDGAK